VEEILAERERSIPESWRCSTRGVDQAAFADEGGRQGEVDFL